MTFVRLLLRNLRYHWRGNVAVFLGVALGAAVLTGALLVGDSLRGSLRDLTLKQLGWVDQALTPGRFFRQALAGELPARRSVAAILLQGSVTAGADATMRTVPAQVLGVDAGFWDDSGDASWSGQEARVALNAGLAEELQAKVGDSLWLNLQKSDNIPRETLLGKRKSDDVVEALSVTVRAILPDEGQARFNLRPTPEPARNVFVPLKFLQARLNLSAKANAVLLADPKGEPNRMLAEKLDLADWGLKLLTPDARARALVRLLDPRNEDGKLRRLKWQGRVPEGLAKRADSTGILTEDSIRAFYREEHRYLVLQSDRLYLDFAMEKAISRTVDSLPAGTKERLRPTLIYLADHLAFGGKEMPYSVVAAVLADQVPNARNDETLGDGDIRLVDWSESPLKPRIGDSVEVAYYFPDSRNQLQLHKVDFKFRGVLPLVGETDDPDWTPEFPGLTDKLDISGWENPPFPPYSTKLLMKRIKPADEEYWKRYRSTPKAYITLAAGQKLWSTRFGKLTSVRLDVPTDQDPEKAAQDFAAGLRRNLAPEQGGFVVEDVRGRAVRASSGSTDFGVLFLSFSFFLIAAALMLVGLLVRLNIERRASEIGLLAATGWEPARYRRLLLFEGAVLVILGALLGLVGATSYAAAMLRLLAVNWPGGRTLHFLTLHMTPASFAIGFAASVIVSWLTLRGAVRVLGRLSPRQLLSGETTTGGGGGSAGRLSFAIMVGALVGAIVTLLAGFFAQGHEAQAGAFFGSGFLLLAGLLALVWRWLLAAARPGDPRPTLARLALRNGGRNPVRSLLTVGLLAMATFLIVAVQAFHREPGKDFFEKHAGSGGFRLFAETEVPLFQDLGDPPVLQDLGMPGDKAKLVEGARGLRVQPGDDASCLNLYRPLQPRIVGVPDALLDEGRFAFAASLAKSPEERANPWRLLVQEPADGILPAVLDANSAQWILKVGLGETIETKNHAGESVKLRVVALLKESMFQSEVLVAERTFLKLFPGQEGFRFFLVECAEADTASVQSALNAALAPQGGRVQPTLARLADYLAVENTYLSTFQALGGLGLLLGALGLAIILVRGVWERRGELALLRALGFRGGQLAWLVLAENLFLLVLGLGAGTVAALLAVAPHLSGSGATVLWGQLAQLLGLVVLVGLAAGSIAVFVSLRTPVLTALRRE